MGNKNRLALACLCLAVVALVVVPRSRSAISRALLDLAFPTDTVHGPGFSEDAFRRVQAGMTRQEVERLLGPPLLEIALAGDTVLETVDVATGQVLYSTPLARSARPTGWRLEFTRSGSDQDDYEIRAVILSANRRVVETVSGHHSD